MCASLLLGEFYLTCQVKTLRREVARLEEERASLEFQIERATHEAKAYETARAELLKYPLKAFKDEASFYSSVKSAVKKVTLLSQTSASSRAMRGLPLSRFTLGVITPLSLKP